MDLWEYGELQLQRNGGSWDGPGEYDLGDSRAAVMNRLGADGWEMVALYPHPSLPFPVAVFKRRAAA